MKIKVRLIGDGMMPKVDNNGDLFDVYASKELSFNAPQAGIQYTSGDKKFRDVSFDSAIIPLGFAMQIPKGFKANLVSRSSTYRKFGIIMANAVGQIDSSYRGDHDEWGMYAIAFKHTTIRVGDRIAQFEIVPSSKATVWQKLRWLFSKKVEFVEVASLNSQNRGGWGSTGNN